MTSLQTAIKRLNEAAIAKENGDWNEAAKCYLFAAEQFDKVAHERSIDALNARKASAEMQRKRDA